MHKERLELIRGEELLVKIGVKVGVFVFRQLGLVGSLVVGWGSVSIPADKGVGGFAQGSQQGDRSCPDSHCQLGMELQRREWRGWVCRGENDMVGFAEGRTAWLGLQRVSSSLKGDLFLLMPFGCENLSDISTML